MSSLFSDASDAETTLKVVRSFQDWAGEVSSPEVPNLEDFFWSLAAVLAKDFKLPRVTVWDNNEYGNCLVLQASFPDRHEKLSHSIPIKGTRTGEAVMRGEISRLKVSNPVLVGEGITQMVTIPVFNPSARGSVILVINLYFKSDDNPQFPFNQKDAGRLLSRLGTVLENQVHKRDKEIESKVRNAAASAKGIPSLFDGVSKHIQEITHCLHAMLFTWDEDSRELKDEGYFFQDRNGASSQEVFRVRQEKVGLFAEEMRAECIGRQSPYVYCTERELPVAITEENTETVQCRYIAVPVISSEGKAIGVLACADPNELARLAPSFSSFDVRALQIFANALSPSVERFLTARKEGRMVQIIKKVSDSMLESYDLHKNLQSVIDSIVEALNSEIASMYMRDGETDVFKMIAARGSNEKLIGRATYRSGEGITGSIVAGEVIHFKSREELIAHPKYTGKYDREIWGDRPDQKETFLGVPVIVNGKVKAVWKVSNVTQSAAHPDPYYTDEDVQIAQVLSCFIAYLIQNHELEEKRLKQFTALANTSLEIQKATDEEAAIMSVMLALTDVEIAGMLLSLYDAQTGLLAGYQVSGTTWAEPAGQYRCHIDDDDIRAKVLRDNEERFEDLLIGDGSTAGRKVSKQFVLPLRVEDELIGTLQFDVESLKLSDRRRLILKAFASHLSIAISRLRSIRQTFDLTNSVIVSSRFITAQTLSAMAVHSIHHKLKEIVRQLREDLARREVRENRFLLDTLKDWETILFGLESDLDDIVTFIRAPSPSGGNRRRDLHPEVHATISTWYNYIRAHKCKVLPPKLEALASACRIPSQTFREILAVLLVNAVQAHAKSIEIRTYNSRDVPVQKNDPTKKDIIRFAFCLECSDDGNGLLTNNPEDIFERTYTTKPANLGSGLGLFVARRLARDAEGDLEVKETGQAKGVTFQLTLPLLEEAQ